VNIRDKISANTQQFLDDDENVEAVFAAQTVSPYWVLINFWILIYTRGFRLVVVTDRRILVCRAGRFIITRCTEVLDELPRSTVIGPATGLWYLADHLVDDRLYIHKRFHKDIALADSLGA